MLLQCLSILVPMWLPLVQSVPTPVAAPCEPVIGEAVTGKCHSFLTRGSGGYPLNGYDTVTTYGRFALFSQQVALDTDDSVFCGFEMFPPLDYYFFNNPAITARWPHRYIPEWMPSPEGPVNPSLGYPAGCGCTDQEVNSIMTTFNSTCDGTASFTAQAQCALSSTAVITAIESTASPCLLHWSAVFNLFDSKLTVFNTMQNFSQYTLLNGNTVAPFFNCAFAAGNTGLYLFSKYELKNTQQQYLTPGRGIISAEVKLPGHSTTTQVFCTHATANVTTPTGVPAADWTFFQNQFNLLQVSGVMQYVEAKAQANPNYRIALLGDPQFAIARDSAPSYLVGNYLDALALFTPFAQSLSMVDAYQVQASTQDIPIIASYNPLAYNGAALATQGTNVSVAHNYINSRCPPDVHQAFSVYNAPETVTGFFGSYTGYASDQFGIRTTVCEVPASASPSGSPRRSPSASRSARPSVSPSRSPRMSPSTSRSPRPSVSPSRSPRFSPSPSPHAGPVAATAAVAAGTHRRLAALPGVMDNSAAGGLTALSGAVFLVVALGAAVALLAFQGRRARCSHQGETAGVC